MDPGPLFDLLAEKELVCHNAAFELGFLATLGFAPGAAVHDTMLLSQLLAAGTFDRVNLAACCERYLSKALDKDEQRSDWSGKLTGEQLAYAALDVQVLVPLLQALDGRLKEAGLLDAAGIEHRCLPALVWMGGKGVAFDVQTGTAMAQQAEADLQRIRGELDAAAPAVPGCLPGLQVWNWDSPAQVKAVLHQLGIDLNSTADEVLATVEHPLGDLLRQHRAVAKLVSGDGASSWNTWPRTAGFTRPGGRSARHPGACPVPNRTCSSCPVASTGAASWPQPDACWSRRTTRRSKCGSPRRCPATSRCWKRTRTARTCTCTARSVLGIQNVTKQHRQLAKALNFGLLYGMGVRGFRQYARSQYGLNLTEQEAGRYREAFFRSYPGLGAWHRRVRSAQDEGNPHVDRPAPPAGLQDPGHSAAQHADSGYGRRRSQAGPALLWERRDKAPGAFPVLAVHDEIVVESPADQAAIVVVWLRTAMVDAMAPLVEPVPVEVEVRVGETWGG